MAETTLCHLQFSHTLQFFGSEAGSEQICTQFLWWAPTELVVQLFNKRGQKRVSCKNYQQGNFIPHSSVTGCISWLRKKLQHSQGGANCGIRREQALKIFIFERATGSNHSLPLGTRILPWTCPVWKTLHVNQNYFLHALVTTGELPVMNSQVTNCCIQLNRPFCQLLSKMHNLVHFYLFFLTITGYRDCVLHIIYKLIILYFEGYEQQILNPNKCMTKRQEKYFFSVCHSPVL